MIYTIGYKKYYEQYFEECKASDEVPRKLGRRDDYEGGSVWRDYQAARTCADRQDKCYGVYGVIADWNEDTAFICGDVDHHALLVDSELVKIECI